MIKQISGSFSFHEYGLSAPSNLVLQLSEDAIIDISKKNIMSYDFVLKSSALNNISGCNRLLDVFTMGMGFLLDVPIYFSYFADFKEVSNLFDTGMLKENIEFERIKYDFKRSTDNEVKIVETNSEAITLLRIEIEQFINKLNSNRTLGSAVDHYLNAIEEPGSFLFSLYKAYEILKDVYNFPKTITKFTRLANDPSILDGRHASNQTINFRWLTQEERKFCKDIIKSGIIDYAA